MPMYDYMCMVCNRRIESLRSIADRDVTLYCPSCDAVMQRVLVAPAMHVWNSERRFPNIVQEGDGSMAFPSKSAYEAHLKQNHLGEVSTDAPIKRSHGAKVVLTDGRSG